MKLIKKYFLIQLVSLFILSGCNSVDDNNRVTVYGKSSANAELVTPATTTDVVVNTRIEVEFDLEMDMSTISSSSFTVTSSGGINVIGEFTFNAENTKVFFTPDENLSSGTQYTVSISESAKDYLGNYFKGDSWIFTTLAAAAIGISSATAELISPAAITDVVVDTRIEIEFAMQMNISTIDSTSFTVSDSSGYLVNGEFTFNAENTKVFFNPSDDLIPETEYTVSISTSVLDFQGNMFIGDSWTFTTKSPTFIVNSFSFGPDYGSHSGVNLQTSITNDSTGDISIQVMDWDNFEITSRSFSLDVSDDTKVNVYYLQENAVDTDYNGPDAELVIRKHYLELAITTNDGTRSWNVNGSGTTQHVIEPFRQLIVDASPDTIIIREKQDESTDILDWNTAVNDTIYAYMQEQFIGNNGPPRGKLEWSWAYCDGSTCTPDLMVSILIPGGDAYNPGDYLYFGTPDSTADFLPITTSDFSDPSGDIYFQKFVVTDASTTWDASSDYSAEMKLTSGYSRIDSMNQPSSASFGTSWETTLGNCVNPDNEDEGSVAAYIGNTYAVFVQFISAVEDLSFDRVTTRVAWYEFILGQWEWQNIQTIEVVQGSPEINALGITGLDLETLDSGCANASYLKVRVPENW